MPHVFWRKASSYIALAVIIAALAWLGFLAYTRQFSSSLATPIALMILLVGLIAFYGLWVSARIVTLQQIKAIILKHTPNTLFNTPLFRSCPLRDLRGGQGGWAQRGELHLWANAGLRYFVEFDDRPVQLSTTPQGSQPVFIFLDDEGGYWAIEFGQYDPGVASVFPIPEGRPLIVSVGNYGRAVFERSLVDA